MAFDTKDERYAMVSFLGLPVPEALPQAAGSFSSKAAAMMLFLFPTSGLPTPTPEPEASSSSSPYQITRLRLLRVLN